MGMGVSIFILMVFLLVQVIHVRSERMSVSSQGISAGKTTDIFSVAGVDYTAYENDKKIFRLRADHFEVAKRRFGMFYLNPLTEASGFNVDLEVYDDSTQKGARNPFVFLTGETITKALPVPDIGSLGVITRIKIEGLKMSLYRDGQLISTVTSQQAMIDPKVKTAILTGNFSVRAMGGKSLISQEGYWDQTTGIFSVEGSYLLVSPQKVRQGNGLRFDINLSGI